MASAQTVRQLRVVTTATWLARELAIAAHPLPVVHDLGLDYPSDDRALAWWCPLSYATRLERSGLHGTWTAPGVMALAQFPREVTQRKVLATTVASLRFGQGWIGSLDEPCFVKIAEAKTEKFPATARSFAQALDDIAAAGLPDDSWLHIQEVLPEPVAEYRCWVRGGKVVAASAYLIGDQTWDAFADDPHPPPTDQAREFADDAVQRCGFMASCPAYTMDVALLPDGRWCVIEVNPAFSSNVYLAGTDPEVARTIIDASSAGPHFDPRWRWHPDALYAQGSLQPLPHRASV